MRDQRLGVQLALRNKLQDLSAVTAIHTARFKCQVFAVPFRQRQYLAAIIQRDDGCLLYTSPPGLLLHTADPLL